MTKVISKEDFYNSGIQIMLRGQIYDVEDLGGVYQIEIDGQSHRIERCQVHTVNDWRNKQLNMILNEC